MQKSSKNLPRDKKSHGTISKLDLIKIKKFRETHLESVREHFYLLQSFLIMKRMEAKRRKLSAERLRFSQSFARRRQRLSQAMVRSTIHRFGNT